MMPGEAAVMKGGERRRRQLAEGCAEHAALVLGGAEILVADLGDRLGAFDTLARRG
jgi:hypothetical protein